MVPFNADASTYQKRYTSFAADIDLVAASALPYPGNPTAPDGTALKTAGRPAGAIRADNAGNITGVSTADAAAGDFTGKTLPFNAGEVQGVQWVKILSSGTTVSGVTVYW